MKESRLFKIVYSILDKGRITAPELAKEFEVSVRTIYRDIDALSAAGIPVYAEAGRHGGISFLDNFVLDKMLVSDDEKKRILSSLQSLSIVNINEDKILTKLSALFHMQLEPYFEVDFSRWGTQEKDNTKFEALKDAIINHRSVTISYINSYGEKNKRAINPIKLLYKAKAWYIKAYCMEKQDFRTFKFNRIVAYEISDKKFSPIVFPDFGKAPPEAYSEIILQFPKEVAYRVYDEFDVKQILEKDEFLIAKARMPEDSWLVGYILSFGTQVEVLQPSHLKNLIAEEAKKIYEKNKP